jgi:translation initiation factor 2 subunit 1
VVTKKGLPKWGELVICTVKRITPYAAWCDLVEYPEVEGMIHVTEVAGRWVRDIREFVKKGKRYVAKVVKIDYQKRHVNLSLKRVTQVDKKRKLDAFRKEQRAEKILEQAAKAQGKTLEQAYQQIGHKLQARFGSLAAAFEEPPQSWKLPKGWTTALQEVIARVVKPKETLIRVELELTSCAGDGIRRIRDVLTKLAKRAGVSIKYISAPRYRAELVTTQPKLAERQLREELDILVKKAKAQQIEASYRFIK